METPTSFESPGWQFIVLTVPMRNGNLIQYLFLVLHTSGSYRTYEEWKLTNEKSFTIRIYSSYRTYEEWKPFCTSAILIRLLEFLPYLWGMETTEDGLKSCQSSGSYRTYEEWKLMYLRKSVHKACRVLTVPMRNGNRILYRCFLCILR